VGGSATNDGECCAGQQGGLHPTKFAPGPPDRSDFHHVNLLMLPIVRGSDRESENLSK
jgi:hypothetical protein